MEQTLTPKGQKRTLAPPEHHKRIKLLRLIEDDYGLGEVYDLLESIIADMTPPPALIYHRNELLAIPESDPFLSVVYSAIGSDRQVKWQESLSIDDMQDLNPPPYLKQSQRLRLLHVLLDDAPSDLFAKASADAFMEADLPLQAGEFLFLQDKIGLWRRYATQPGQVVNGAFFVVKTHFQ